MKNKIILLVFLVFIFFSIMFLGDSNKNIKDSIIFKNEIKLQKNQLNDNFEIGKINLENTGFLTVKYKMPEFIACTNSNSQIYLNYQNSYYNEFNIFGDNQNEIEIKSKEKREITITTFYYYLSPEDEKNINLSKNFTISIFENNNLFDSCYSDNKKEITKIEVIIE